MIGHWWLTPPLSPIPPPQESGDGTESFNPLILVDAPATSPYPHGLSKSHLLNINSVVVEWGLLRITGHSFHLYGSGSNFRNWGQETRYYNVRCFHWSSHLGNSEGFGNCESGTMDGRQKYIFILNYNIKVFLYFWKCIFSVNSNNEAQLQK